MEVSLRNRINGRLLQFASYWVKTTCKLNVSGMEHFDAVRAMGKPVLWTTWHGQSMTILPIHTKPEWRQRLAHKKVMVMIPEDWRGETLHAWLTYSGLTPRPMDLENRDMGTARQFAQLVRTIKQENYDNFIAPDGPAGPSFEVKPGAAFLAQKVGSPLLPIAAYARFSYEVNRWDAYMIPLPFSRIEIVVGEPLEISRQASPADVATTIQTALNKVTLQAKANYYAAAGH